MRSRTPENPTLFPQIFYLFHSSVYDCCCCCCSKNILIKDKKWAVSTKWTVHQWYRATLQWYCPGANQWWLGLRSCYTSLPLKMNYRFCGKSELNSYFSSIKLKNTPTGRNIYRASTQPWAGVLKNRGQRSTDGYSEAWSKSTFEVKSIKELMRMTEEFEAE